jgi:hypothetical protein
VQPVLKEALGIMVKIWDGEGIVRIREEASDVDKFTLLQ